MILAFDTYYRDTTAKTVCLQFHDWTDKAPAQVLEETLEDIAPYESGAFYKRELPCILSLLAKIDLAEVTVIVIDGFVFLDDAGTAGLGARLYTALGAAIPVIGVAKTNFATLEIAKRALLRGESKSPLFITAVGIDLDLATEKVRSMHGPYRIPELLKLLDGFTRI